MQGSLSRSEEDHLKAVISLEQAGETAFTNAIAEKLRTRASSVTSMVGKLARKGLLTHRPYHGVTLTKKGRTRAVDLVRRHRLWETLLVQRLGLGWDEVHEMAEELEHVSSDRLIDRLDHYLGHPSFDPHGDPIPDRNGRIHARATRRLESCKAGEIVRIAAVSETTDGLLRLLDSRGLRIGTVLTVTGVHAFDGSMDIKPRRGAAFSISRDVSHHLQVENTGAR